MKKLVLFAFAMTAAFGQFKPVVKGLDRAGTVGPQGPPGSPAGGASEVQINSAGVFGSNANFKFFPGTGNLTVGASTDGGGDRVQITGSALITSYLTMTQLTAPSAPPAGTLRWYAKTGAGFCWKDSGGAETCAGLGVPAGATSQIQINNAGSFGADTNFRYFTGTGNLVVGASTDNGANKLQITGSSLFTGAIQHQSYTDSQQIAAPANPAAGYLRVYAKSGAGICWRDSGGVETCAGAGGAGTPAGASSDVQLNSSGLFGSSSNFRYFTGTGNLVVGSPTDDASANKLQVSGSAWFKTAGSTEVMSETTASTGSNAILSLKSATQKWLLYHSPDNQSLSVYDAIGATSTADFFSVASAGGMRARFNYPIVQQTYSDNQQIAAPGTPATGYLRVYAKTGAGICWKDSTGTETCAGAAGTGGSGTPAGVSADVQFNNGGTFGSNANFKYFTGTGNLVVGGATDDGTHRLQVMGDTRFWSAATPSMTIESTTTGNYPQVNLKGPSGGWQWAMTTDTNLFYIQDQTNTTNPLIIVPAAPNRILLGGGGSDDGTHVLQLHGTAKFDNYQTVTQIAAPATPAAGTLRWYAKTGAGFCWKDSGGTETCPGTGGSGGGAGTVQIQADNTNVGVPTGQIDFVQGDNINVVLNNTGTEVTTQINAGSGLQTKLDDIKGTHLKCYSTDGTDTYTAAMSTTISSAQLADGMQCLFKATTANTGAATLNIDTVGAKSILRADGSALQNSDIKANRTYRLSYDGTNFLMPTILERMCEIHIWGTGASSVLQDTDDEAFSCINEFTTAETVTGVWCRADTGTPTVTPIVTGGAGLLTGALTCGAGTLAAGTVSGTPSIAVGGSIDANITTAGGAATNIRLLVRLSR